MEGKGGKDQKSWRSILPYDWFLIDSLVASMNCYSGYTLRMFCLKMWLFSMTSCFIFANCPMPIYLR